MEVWSTGRRKGSLGRVSRRCKRLGREGVGRGNRRKGVGGGSVNQHEGERDFLAGFPVDAKD